jgi:fluoroacetyl-CoA thioesterase
MGRPVPGEEATIEVTVTPEMTARLFGRQMNPLYGTVSMVLHVEESGRTIVDRHLDPEEDAVGYRIEVTHEAPARVGDVLRVTARVVHADERECVTEHEVLGPAGVVGRARFVQRYVRRMRDGGTGAG